MLYRLLTACIILVASSVHAGFTNNGTWESDNLYFSVKGTLENNGLLVGYQSATIVADSMRGTGILRSPKILIEVESFEYTGTIDCSEECTIRSAIPFDETQFKQEGEGKFTILCPCYCMEENEDLPEAIIAL